MNSIFNLRGRIFSGIDLFLSLLLFPITVFFPSAICYKATAILLEDDFDGTIDDLYIDYGALVIHYSGLIFFSGVTFIVHRILSQSKNGPQTLSALKNTLQITKTINYSKMFAMVTFLGAILYFDSYSGLKDFQDGKLGSYGGLLTSFAVVGGVPLLILK